MTPEQADAETIALNAQDAWKRSNDALIVRIKRCDELRRLCGRAYSGIVALRGNHPPPWYYRLIEDLKAAETDQS